ncbi:hypothetical protein FS749_000114 [Ceratobasidium sp. UAMH 11750]|nr:hypothetical protein FS749_000114 [Ceratobasidium sp. UAMH 11750]
MAALPLRTPRLVILALTWALGVVGAAAGLNAIVKRNQQVAAIRKAVSPLHITVDVDTNNILRSGIVLSVGCLLLSIATSIFIGLIILDSRKSSSTSPLSTRTLPVQTGVLAFLSVWILATVVAVTKFAAHGSAGVLAYSGGRQLPDTLVVATEKRLGFSRVYWAQLYGMFALPAENMGAYMVLKLYYASANPDRGTLDHAPFRLDCYGYHIHGIARTRFELYDPVGRYLV